MSSVDYLGLKRHMVKLLPQLLVINFHHHGGRIDSLRTSYGDLETGILS